MNNEKLLKAYAEYRGNQPCPDDFADYWQDALQEIAGRVPSFVLSNRIEMLPNVIIQDGYFASFDGIQIACRLVAPAFAENPGPGIILYHGYTQHKPDVFLLLPYILSGFTVLAIDCRDQGGDTIQYEASMRGNLFRGVRAGRAHLYLKQIYLDAVLAYRMLAALPTVDKLRVGVTGGSQGGTLALVVAALEKNVKFAAVSSPFLSDFRKVMDLGLFVDVYEELGWYFRMFDPQHKREDEFFETLSYVDLKNFTPNVTSPVLWILGGKDPTCPPATQMAAYNGLAGEKRLEVYPDAVHELFPGRHHHVADQLYFFAVEYSK